MQTIDSHCHFWRLDRGDYGWLDGEGGALDPIRRDFGLADYPGKGQVIAVQAAPTLAETDYLLALAAADDRIAGVVGWVDMADEGAAGVLRWRAADPCFKGIRPMLQDIAASDWIATAPHPAVVEALVHYGLRFDALVTARHLPYLAGFAASNPDLPVVIDHAAKPRPGEGPDWERGMRRLAENPAIYCKFSGLMTELSEGDRADPLPALSALFGRLLEWFGPRRLIWGSDWPVLTLAASFERWAELTDELLAPLSEAERTAILGGNAARFYGVEP